MQQRRPAGASPVEREGEDKGKRIRLAGKHRTEALRTPCGSRAIVALPQGKNKREQLRWLQRHAPNNRIGDRSGQQ